MKRPAPSWIERNLAKVAPRAAMRRYAARVTFEAASGYVAARGDRPAMRNVSVRPGTADQDTLPNLEVMRAISRDMQRNEPLAGGAINTVVTNVAGTGLRLSAQVDRRALLDLIGASPDEAEAFEQAAEREWRMFCRREYCDVTRELSFGWMQELAFRSVLESGDVLLHMAQAASGPFDFGVQLIEADRIRNPRLMGDNDDISGGVERDAVGRVVAYHVADVSRTTGQVKGWTRVPAWGNDDTPRALLLMHKRRIGQSRGVPYLAPVIALLKDLGRYTEAELTAAVMNACLAVVSTSKDGFSPLATEAAGAGSNTKSGDLRRLNITFEPGMTLEGFADGEEIKGMPVDRPSTNFDPFALAILRQIGVGLELPFELLVKHFTASYSAARAALLQAWLFFRARRAWLAETMCQPVYEAVLMSAVRRGRIKAEGFLDRPEVRLAWCGAQWTGPSAGQIDPLKEVNAAEKRLLLKLSSRTRETAELTGDDWQSVAAEIATERDLMDELGLATDAVAPVDPALTEPDPSMDQPEPA